MVGCLGFEPRVARSCRLKVFANCAEVSLVSHRSAQVPTRLNSIIQVMPHIFWCPKFHFRFKNSLPLLRILRQNNAVHALPSHFCKLHYNFIIPPTPRSYVRYLSSTFHHQKSECFSLSSTCATCPAHLISSPLFNYPKLLIMNFVHSPITCLLLGPKYNSEPYSQTPPASVLPLNLETKFQIPIQQ